MQATTISPWVVTLDALRPFRCVALVMLQGDQQCRIIRCRLGGDRIMRHLA